ncbi:class I SAM-dependent methyltransferase [Mucilaginibacter myungsuensis]|uniref:FkbM family methyltransferase n=1 Tax=Mucilaginibacter myungsuensis TaxID=649104 RepID=A0A929PWM1_9SPHI|nr:FkbM family methyltransferase [Mucilaginibacter myungsuensis]MBE9662284.1 FkbM family methyltransferase [Mucilaginibacter myungsuensis]MDN3599280.1 FkbM family methyltransferase [Mucilaginibacter myungsuensis]
MSNFSTILELLARPARLRSILSFNKKGYLKEIGWFASAESRSPVDKYGSPIPWVTYSFIDFIKERLTKEHSVFEFGSGNSTHFYAKYAGRVVSVEHDRAWFDKIQDGKAANSELVFTELKTDGDYCRVPVTRGEKYDIIIVDGRDRVNCCKQAVDALTPSGVVVLDDSERDFYSEGVNFLKDRGFKQLPFSGISPGLFYPKATSVFYRADNCLGI